MKIHLSTIFIILIYNIFSPTIWAENSDTLFLGATNSLSAGDSLSLGVADSYNPYQVSWPQIAVPATAAVFSGLFVKTPKLVQARHWVQHQLANHSGQPRTKVDDYLPYIAMAGSYGLYFGGLKGEHNLLDRTILLAMSYASFAIVSNGLKWTVNEQRPNAMEMNSFPSNHTGTAFVGAEFLRREYWNTNKWIAMSGYAFGIATAYLRIYNNRHWINDVVCGASIGYLSTTFAYWLYPRIFRRNNAESHNSYQKSTIPQNSLADEEALPNHQSDRCKPIFYAIPTISTDYLGATALITF